MFIVNNYLLAVIFCFVTMLCWGSWGNTQKLAAKNWRYELFYWDYVIGMVLFAFFIALTMGSFGNEGRPFIKDVAQADSGALGSIILGGVIFNASNILLAASTSIAGLAVAFPLGVGISLVLGTVINYIGSPSGDPLLLFTGVALIAAAIICNGIASGKHSGGKKEGAGKGISLAAVAGTLMAFFYRFVAASMDLDNFADPAEGKVTPYTAIVIFSLGVLGSNFIFNTLVMKKPFVGEPVRYKQYFAGNLKTHLVGMLGGAIWCLGTAFSYIASGKAGAAVSYALGQGAPLVAAVWGVFIWKEFKGAGRSVKYLLTVMFIFFIGGLGFIIAAGDRNEAEDCGGPVKVIIETDMGNDIDDALALVAAFNAMDLNQMEVLAVGCHKMSGTSARYIDVLDTYYGHPEVEIAQAPGPVENVEDYTAACCSMGFAQSRDGQFQDPVKLYRRILSEAKDGSVAFVSLGFGTSLAQLLDSQPDEFSPLTGKELLERKARVLSIMAGSYGDRKIAEYNVVNDIPAMKKLFEEWPSDIVQNPFEIGMQVLFPAEEIELNLGYESPNPVVEGYKFFKKMPYNRPSWDILSVIFLLRPDLFTRSLPGRITVDSEGYTWFETEEGGRHTVLSATPEQAQALMEYQIGLIRK